MSSSNYQYLMTTNIYYVGFGFINTTIGQGSLNSSNFVTILDNYYTNLTQNVKSDIVAKNWLNFCLDTSYFIRNVDPLVNTGLWLLYSAVIEYRGYISTMTNPTQLTQNIAYKFGNIFDRGYELYLLYEDLPNLEVPQYTYMGDVIGRMFNYTFFPQNYGPPKIVYPATTLSI